MGPFWVRTTLLWVGALTFALGSLFTDIGTAGAARPPKEPTGCLLLSGAIGSATVVLDPGHGGSDPGAVNSAYGLVEKEQTLIVAEQAAAILAGQGVSVALTRYDNATTLGNSERGEIANACGAKLFVSIHFNASTNPDANYTQTFWGKRRKDEAFSWTMHNALWPTLASYGGSTTNLTDGGVGQFATGSLLQAEMPSTLVEAVFLSNPAEASRLADGTGSRQAQIAQAIASGAVAGLGG